MCGIAGIVSPSPVPMERIRAATGTLTHRGPEAEGFYLNTEGTAGLGHRRLCVIDLSAQAAQPMSYAGRYTIVYNGEIYNYIELKEELVKKGFSFFSGSDTEVVVASYAAFGTACLQHFDGAFAFAIWDNQEQTLFAARDRFGEKPFFYTFNDTTLCFASELNALWTLGADKKVNTRMLYNFLTIGYTSNPYDPGETFYNDVHKLPAASFFLYTLGQTDLVVENYWQVHMEPQHLSKEDAVEQVRALLSASVAKRLRSDVPIGTSLSGGLDSSLVVALCEAHQQAQYTHRCFTASFPGFERDEMQFAAAVAERFGLQHTVVTPEGAEVVALMAAIVRGTGEPVTSASAIAQYKVYAAAKQSGITVLLDGQGADEIFGGYPKYYPWYWSELYRGRRLEKSGELAAAKALGVKESFGVARKTAALVPHLAFALQQTRKKKSAFRSTHLHRDFAFAHKDASYYSLPAHADLNSALYFNTFSNGLEELLRIADRNSMAHGVEVRLPYLDHKLVETLFSLPATLKIRDGWTKWLLRKVAEPLLPADVTWRKGKVGFEPPQKAWMQRKDVADAITAGKLILEREGILAPGASTKKNQPHDAYAADNEDWKCWSASFLYT